MEGIYGHTLVLDYTSKYCEMEFWAFIIFLLNCTMYWRKEWVCWVLEFSWYGSCFKFDETILPYAPNFQYIGCLLKIRINIPFSSNISNHPNFFFVAQKWIQTNQASGNVEKQNEYGLSCSEYSVSSLKVFIHGVVFGSPLVNYFCCVSWLRGRCITRRYGS